MVTDGQVRRLLRELDSGTSLATAVRRAGMSDKTARHYRDDRTPSSTRKKSHVPRTYRTRPDPSAVRMNWDLFTAIMRQSLPDASREVPTVRYAFLVTLTNNRLPRFVVLGVVMNEPNNSDCPPSPLFAETEDSSSSLRRGTRLIRPIGILVLDDDAIARCLLDSGLCQFGFAVWTASDSAEAVSISAINQSSVDLVLFDVRIAGRDGPEMPLTSKRSIRTFAPAP